VSDAAPVLISTAALLGVAVLAGAAGAAVAHLRAGLDALRTEQARDRASIAALRAAVRRIDHDPPELDDEPDAPQPIGFRRP
jgi:hypothetical protein